MQSNEYKVVIIEDIGTNPQCFKYCTGRNKFLNISKIKRKEMYVQSSYIK